MEKPRLLWVAALALGAIYAAATGSLALGNLGGIIYSIACFASSALLALACVRIFLKKSNPSEKYFLAYLILGFTIQMVGIIAVSEGIMAVGLILFLIWMFRISPPAEENQQNEERNKK